MKPKWAPEGLPGGVWAAWGPLGPLPGWSWAPLGALRESLGAVLGALGPLLGPLFLELFGSLLKVPLRDAKTTNIDDSTSRFEVFSRSNRSKIASKPPPGAPGRLLEAS